MRKPISITLSPKALKELDKFAEISALESRSRTTEELILTFSQIRDIYKLLLENSQITDTKRMVTNPNMTMAFLSQISVILDRLGIGDYILHEIKSKPKVNEKVIR